MPIHSAALYTQLSSLLSSRGYNPKSLDSSGKAIPVPDEADVIRFDFNKDGKKYGNAWASIDSANKLVIYYGDDISSSPNTNTSGTEFSDTWSGLINHLKNWAQRRQLSFELENESHLESDMAQRTHMKQQEKIAESTTKPKFAEKFQKNIEKTAAKAKETSEKVKQHSDNATKKKVEEGYYATGKKTSYSDNIPAVKIVLQHSRALEEGEKRFRSIEKIFVENQQGERFLLDTNKPGLARVYARHIAEGGTPYDAAGKHIHSLVEEYTKMAGFVRATRGNQFNESTQSLVYEGTHHYHQLRETLHKLSGSKGYASYFENWSPTLTEEADDIPYNDISEMFSSNSLDPRIESVMPILKKLHTTITEMSEVTDLTEWADQIIGEQGRDEPMSDADYAKQMAQGQKNAAYIGLGGKPAELPDAPAGTSIDPFVRNRMGYKPATQAEITAYNKANPGGLVDGSGKPVLDGSGRQWGTGTGGGRDFGGSIPPAAAQAAKVAEPASRAGSDAPGDVTSEIDLIRRGTIPPPPTPVEFAPYAEPNSAGELGNRDPDTRIPPTSRAGSDAPGDVTSEIDLIRRNAGLPATAPEELPAPEVKPFSNDDAMAAALAAQNAANAAKKPGEAAVGGEGNPPAAPAPATKTAEPKGRPESETRAEMAALLAKIEKTSRKPAAAKPAAAKPAAAPEAPEYDLERPVKRPTDLPPTAPATAARPGLSADVPGSVANIANQVAAVPGAAAAPAVPPVGYTKVPAAAPAAKPVAATPAATPAAATPAASSTNVRPQPTLNGKPSTGPKGQAWLAQYGTTHNANGTPKAGQAGKPASTVKNAAGGQTTSNDGGAATSVTRNSRPVVPGSLRAQQQANQSALGLKESEMTFAERMAYFTSKLDNISSSSSKTSVQLNENSVQLNEYIKQGVQLVKQAPNPSTIINRIRGRKPAAPGAVAPAAPAARAPAAPVAVAPAAAPSAVAAAAAAPAAAAAAAVPRASRMAAITQSLKNNPKKYAALIAALGLAGAAAWLYNRENAVTPPGPAPEPAPAPGPAPEPAPAPGPAPEPAPAPTPDQGGKTEGPDAADIEKLNALARELENSNDPATVNLMTRYNHVINSINNGSPDDMTTYGAQALVRSTADGLADAGLKENYDPKTDYSILEAIKQLTRKSTNEGSIDKDGVWTDKPPKPGQPNVPAPTDPEGVSSVKKPVVKKPTTTNTTVVKEFDESTDELNRILHIMNHRR